MGKKIGFVVGFMIVSFLIDYLLVCYRDTRPLFAIQQGDTYIGIGYKAWHCRLENGKYKNEVGFYNTKYACPEVIENVSKEVKPCVFTNTYYLLHDAPSHDEKYHYLTLRKFQDEPVVTVKVLRSLNETMEVGNAYEFTFEYKEGLELGEIDSIFSKATLLEIKSTDKVGLEQIQTSCR